MTFEKAFTLGLKPYIIGAGIAAIIAFFWFVWLVINEKREVDEEYEREDRK